MDESINLIDYWRIILKRKKSVTFIVGLMTAASAAYSLTLPNIYKASATIMQVGGQKASGIYTLASQMGLSGLVGSGLGVSSEPNQLLMILNSRTLAERVIEKNGLAKILAPTDGNENHQRPPMMEDIVNSLFAMVHFIDSESGMVIRITADHQDPKFAAEVVNEYIEELDAYIKENTLTAAKRNRIFIEGQLERSKIELLESGKELSFFYGANKISNAIPKVDVDVASTKMQGDTARRQEDVSGSGVHEEDQTFFFSKKLGLPAVSEAYADVRAKRTEELQQKTALINGALAKARVVKDVPQQVYLQYLVLKRELLGQINTLLTQQYEMAKIDEAKEGLNFKVLDSARVPMRKFKPLRRQMVMITCLASFFLAVFYAIFKNYLEKTKPL